LVGKGGTPLPPSGFRPPEKRAPVKESPPPESSTPVPQEKNVFSKKVVPKRNPPLPKKSEFPKGGTPREKREVVPLLDGQYVL